jgi:hypothetical protein
VGTAGLGRRDPDSGRRRYVDKTVRGGKREAELALAAMVAEVDRGGLRDSTSTVAELLERWFEHGPEASRRRPSGRPGRRRPT